MDSNEEIFLISTFYETIDDLPEKDYDPEKYLRDNLDRLLTLERIEYVYNEILAINEQEANAKLDSIIDCLCYTYLVANFEKKSLVTKYLINTDKEEVYRLFKSTPNFGEELLRSFFSFVGRKDELQAQEEEIKTEDPNYNIMKYAYNINVTFITTYLRETYMNLIETLLKYGYGMEEAIRCVSLLLRNDTMALGSDELLELINTLKQYAPFLVRLMFSDIYTCLATTSLFDQDIANYMAYCAEIQVYMLPENDELRENIFAFFLYIASDDELRKKLESMVTKEDLQVLKRINPYYGIE